MGYPYYTYSYNYVLGQAPGIIIAVLAVIILAVVLNFTFLSKKNEGKYTGFLGKLYNFLCFNKFYLEEILKLLYVVSAAVITLIGLFTLFFANFIVGLIFIVCGNIVIRIIYELSMMFIILCRKTVSVDKKLDKISKFYGDDFDDDPAEPENEAAEVFEKEGCSAEVPDERETDDVGCDCECEECSCCAGEPDESIKEDEGEQINTSDR